MRDLQLQTPKRHQPSANRRSRSNHDVKALRKVATKSLNQALEPDADSECDSEACELIKDIPEVSDYINVVDNIACQEIAKKSSNPAFEAAVAYEDNPATFERINEIQEVSSDIDIDDNTDSEIVKKSLSPDNSEHKFAAIVDVSADINIDNDTASESIASINPGYTHSSDTDLISDLNFPSLQSFSIVATDKHVVLENGVLVSNITEEKFEMDVMVNALREARHKLYKSKDLGTSKKLLDYLVGIHIDGLNGGFSEEKWPDKLVSTKAICLIIAVYLLIALFLRSGDEDPYYPGLRPT